MISDTQFQIGIALFLASLLFVAIEHAPSPKSMGAALLWLLRKLCWLLAVLAWASVTLLAAIIAAVVIVAWLLESPRDRRMTLAARRRFT